MHEPRNLQEQQPMAHQLADRNGTAEKATFHVASEGAPWHKLGRALDAPPTAADAIREAGLDYEVASLPMFAGGPSGPIAVPTHCLNVRTDNLAPLGLVSDKYKVVQNREAFDFLDSLALRGEVRYHTAGALGRGERIWMLAKLPGDLMVRGTEDRVEKYLLLYNSHDASSALRCLWTPIRVVCANTVSAALRRGEGTGISIWHLGEIRDKVDAARRALGLATEFFEAFGEGADFLAGYTPTRDQLDAYFRALYPDPPKGDAARAKSARMTLFGLFEQGMGQDMPGIRGTAWAALNAVTEYVDHHTGTDPRRRMESSWYGDGQKMKARAFDAAIAMAK
jgi:phage/plasmid-like protein (TIGR03299 family)